MITPKPDLRPGITKAEAMQLVERITSGLPLVPSSDAGWTMNDLFCIAGAAIAIIQSIPQAGMYSKHGGNSYAEDAETERRCAITVTDLARSILMAIHGAWDQGGCGETYWAPSPIDNGN